MKKTRLEVILKVKVKEWVSDADDPEEITDIIHDIEKIEGVDDVSITKENVIDTEEYDPSDDDIGE
jgi:hypothetical protein